MSQEKENRITEENPYVKCPVFETESLLLRLIQQEDSESLFTCYNDKEAVALMNDDNCDFGFYVDTKEKMAETVGYWIDFYKKGYFIRFAVVEKKTGTVVGTIEGFGGETGVLRVDLASACEKENYLKEIFDVTREKFKQVFGNEKLVTKAVPEAVERRRALENSGWNYIGTYRDFADYYEIKLD